MIQLSGSRSSWNFSIQLIVTDLLLGLQRLASLHWAQNCTESLVLEVIFSLPTKQRIGSNGNLCYQGAPATHKLLGGCVWPRCPQHNLAEPGVIIDWSPPYHPGGTGCVQSQAWRKERCIDKDIFQNIGVFAPWQNLQRRKTFLSRPNISTGKINCFYRYVILY